MIRHFFDMNDKTKPSALWLLLAALVLNGYFSCKKGDGRPPTIAVSAPLDGDTFVACDEVRIIGRATDNQALAEVTATLSHPFTNQIIGSASTSISGLEAEFAFSLKMGDRYTPSDAYQLRVSAVDAAGNVASDFILPNITELPKVFLQAAWAGVNSAGQAQLFYEDILAQLQTGPILGTQLADLSIDNRSQALLVAEQNSGRFDGRNLEDFALSFRTDLPGSAQQAPSITGIAHTQNRYYLSLGTPPYLRVFDRSGLQISAWSSVPHPAQAILASPDLIYIGVVGFGGSPVAVQAYDRNSQALMTSHLPGFPAEQLRLTGDGQLIAGGNHQGQGRIHLLDAQSLSLQASNDLNAAFLDVAGAGMTWFVLLDSGLWQLDLSSANLQGPIVNGAFTSLAFEETSGNVWIGRENAVDIYSPSGNLLRSITGNFGTVSEIVFHYNK